MLNSILSIIGAVGASIASLPQIIRSFERDSTGDLHLGTMTVRLLSCLAWSLYGYNTSQNTLFLSGLISSVGEIILIVAKCRDIVYYITIPGGNI